MTELCPKCYASALLERARVDRDPTKPESYALVCGRLEAGLEVLVAAHLKLCGKHAAELISDVRAGRTVF